LTSDPPAAFDSQMPEQDELPAIEGIGVAPLRIPELDALAEAYVKERDKRMKQTPKEIAAKEELIDALHLHADRLEQEDGTLLYRYGDMRVTLEPGKEKLKVKEIPQVSTM
jgi:hypothetical protein